MCHILGRRAPSREGTTSEEYMRFWVHSLESASKMADEIGIDQTPTSLQIPCTRAEGCPSVSVLSALWV